MSHIVKLWEIAWDLWEPQMKIKFNLAWDGPISHLIQFLSACHAFQEFLWQLSSPLPCLSLPALSTTLPHGFFTLRLLTLDSAEVILTWLISQWLLLKNIYRVWMALIIFLNISWHPSPPLSLDPHLPLPTPLSTPFSGNIFTPCIIRHLYII